jgi:hypothetical protein
MDARWWVEVLSAATAPVTAAIATYIAYQQWRTNRQRLRLELYDRRAAVLRAVREHLSRIQQNAHVEGDSLAAFVKAAAEADFLFDRPLVQYLDEIYKKSIHMCSLHEQLEGIPVGPERNKVVKEHWDLILWMSGQLPILIDRFRKYLRVN